MKTQKNRAMVISVQGRKAVVLTSAGDFKRIQVPTGTQPGQTIVTGNPVPSWFAAVAAIVVLLLAWGTLQPFWGASPAVAASLAVDMSASVELHLDQKGNVVAIIAGDERGARLIEGLNLVGRHAYPALITLTGKAAEQHLLNQNGENLVFVGIIPWKEGLPPVTLDTVQQVIHDEMLVRNYKGYIVVSDVQQNKVEEAADAGMPVTRFMIMDRFSQSGVPVETSKFTGPDLSAVLIDPSDNLERAFPGGWCSIGNRHRKPVNQSQTEDQSIPVPVGLAETVPSPTEQEGAQSPTTNPGTTNVPEPYRVGPAGPMGPMGQWMDQAGPGSFWLQRMGSMEPWMGPRGHMGRPMWQDMYPQPEGQQ